MSLNDYTRLSPKDVFVSQFQENLLAGRRYRLSLVRGQAVEGIPTAMPGDPSDFRIRTGTGDAFKIPFADVLGAEQIELGDRYFMELAIKESRKCRPEAGRESPVPKVGAVLVVDGRVVGVARRNELVSGDVGDEGDHAEMTLLEKKLKDAENIAGGTLYTTLEPCCSERHHPNKPCTAHIIARRIRKVVIGILDPNQAICGKGVWRLREAGIDVSLCDSDLTREIEDVNRQFIGAYRENTIGASSGTVAASQARASDSAPAVDAQMVNRLTAVSAPSFIRADFDFPVVYRGASKLAARVRLWTVQRIPAPLRIHAWRLVRVLIDGREVPPSDRFNERVISVADTGRTDLQQEVEFSLSEELAQRPQVTISAQLQLEIMGFDPPPVMVPVEEKYCRMSP